MACAYLFAQHYNPSCAPAVLQNQGGATAAQSGAGAYIAPAMAAGGGAAVATRIVTLQEAVTLEELASEEEYNDILEDMREECSKV